MPTSAEPPRFTADLSAVDDGARLVTVDATRALALLGVMIMNFHSISGLELMGREAAAARFGPVDGITDLLMAVLLDAKALSVFAFMFGVSFTLLLDNRRRRGEPFVALYLRRLLFLLCFGILNAALFYWGDILSTYAVFGLVLLVASYLPQRVVLTLAAAALIGVPLGLAMLGLTIEPAGASADRQALEAFAQPSISATIAQNIDRFFGTVESYNPYKTWRLSNIGGLFLLGFWIGRTAIPHRIRAHRPLLTRVALVALPLGLAIAVAHELTPAARPVKTALLVGTPILAIGYVAVAALVLEHHIAQPLRIALAPLGRAALTGYLTTGLVGQALFYGWGLGLLTEVGAATVLMLAIAVFIVMLLAAQVWFSYFRYGPWEWLWRCLTHQRWQLLRYR